MSDHRDSVDVQPRKTAPDTGGIPPADSELHWPIDAAPDEVHLMDHVKVIYKRRWIAMTVFVIALLSAVAYTFTATPIFEARTRLLIEIADPNVVAFKEVIEEGQPNPDYYQTQYSILQSRALARRVIEGQGLWNSPYLVGTPATPGFGIGTLVGPLTSLFREPPPASERPAEETARQSRAIDAFLANLTVEPIRNSRLVDVKFRSTSPVLAARVANALGTNYIEQTLEYKYTASQEASQWLAERLAEQRREVEQAEAKLQAYREQNDAISVEDGENIVVQKLADLSAAVTRAKTERIHKETTERQLRAIERNPAALEMFPPILGNAFIQRQKAEIAELQQQQAELAERLGELHPEMLRLQSVVQSSQAKLRAEIGKVVEALHTEYQAARTQEQSLVGALEQQKVEALSMNRKAIEYTVLARDVESGRQVYESLLQRAKETGVSGELKTSNIRVVDKAEEPLSAIRPRPRADLTLGALAGLILALGVAFLVEYVDNRLKSPEEIRACLGIPSLGIIPEISSSTAVASTPLLHNGAPQAFAEAFRAFRTNVLFSSPDETRQTLVVTSTGPGEGKTLVACNLAIGFALAGQRVLLIDADMRRPRGHEVFELQQEPGLSNLLVGDVNPSEALRKTNVAGLRVLTAGRVAPNPAELLGSKRFKDFLASLDDIFDTIIIDTPPAMVVADSLIASRVATGIVFVVGAEMTSRYAAQTAIAQFARGRTRVLGAALNRVQLEKHSYYYSRYYRREYAAYYSAAAS
jgi:capsular exopolysaccharide synthesis family protein